MKRRTFTLWFGLAAGLLSAALPAPGGAATAPLPGAESAGSAWRTRGADAFAEAKKGGKLVLVDLYADWCGWCKVMDREVFASPAFRKQAERFVLLRLDTEDRGEGAAMANRFRATSLPLMLILDANQALVSEIRGYRETNELLPLLDSAIAGHKAFVAEFDRVLAGDDAARWLAKAKEMHGRGDGPRAAAAYEKVLAVKHLSGDALGWARLQLADAYRMGERFDDAKRAAIALRTELAAAAPGVEPTPESRLIAERVDLLLLYIAGGAHDCTDAAQALAAFVKGYPKSQFLADAQRAFRSTTRDNGSQCS